MVIKPIQQPKEKPTMSLSVILERLEHAGIKAEVIGDDRNSKLVVDGNIVGDIIGDTVYMK